MVSVGLAHEGNEIQPRDCAEDWLYGLEWHMLGTYSSAWYNPYSEIQQAPDDRWHNGPKSDRGRLDLDTHASNLRDIGRAM